MKRVANTCILTLFLFFCTCIQSYSQKKVGDTYKGGVLYEIYGDGSGGKVIFGTASQSYDAAKRYLENHYENGVKCYMADDYDLQTLLQLKLIGPEKGDGGWGHLWWMGDRRMVSYGKPFQYTASGILNLPVTSSGTERTAAIIQFGWKADRYDSKSLFAIMGIVSWPIGSNVYKPTAAEIKQAQIDEKKRAIQAQIDEKKRLEQAKIDEKNRAIQAQIDEKKRLEQVQIDEKKRLDDIKDIINEVDNPFEIAINSYTMGTSLKIARKDFPDKMTWADAKIACSNLGDGWHLPSKDELEILYENKNKVPNITNDDYWSSSEFSSSSNLYGVRAWNQFFSDGQMINSLIDNKKKVRAIWSKKVADDVKKRREDELDYAKRRREIAINDSILSSKSIIIGKIEVYKEELKFPWGRNGICNFMQAEKACLELGDNWRLPTINELKKIAKDKNNNERVVRDCFIWSSSEGKNSDEILMLNPYSGKVYSARKVEGGNARPVRSYEPTSQQEKN